MNDSEVWGLLKETKELRVRMSIAAQDNEIEEFIRNYIMNNKDDKDAIFCLGFIVRGLYPEQIEYMNKLLVLI